MKQLLIAFTILLVGCTEQITLEDLLTEMTDRTELAKLPKHEHQLYQASSYDRASKSPSENWFANNDHTQYLRNDTTENGIEHVLMEAKAPGAITRFWSTFHSTKFSKGTLRFYIDGARQPAIEGRIDSILVHNEEFGNILAFKTSPFVEDGIDFYGSNIYAPILFGKSCKITYQKRYPEAKDILYYNINYRLYNKGVKIESYAKNSAKQRASYHNSAKKLLAKNQPTGVLKQVKRKMLKANETLKLDFKGAQYIQQIQLKLKAENLEQALRSTVLQLSFDGKQTAWVPVGEFFGTSYMISPSKNWATTVYEDGTMQIDLPMPFKNTAKLELINYAKNSVEIEKLNIYTDAWKWDERSLYLNCNWTLHSRIHSSKKQDLNYNTITGKGKYVGDVLSLYNGTFQWWGEGDEKIYVDGDTFPTHFGTGTEDYFGYAWCSNVNFESPFIAQPKGDGNRTAGMTVNARWRMLDALPFKKSLKFDMELWHWWPCEMDYSTASFWYGTTNATSSIQKDEQALNTELRFSDRFQVDNFKVAKISNGETTSETFLMPDWRVRFEKLWTGIRFGDELVLNFYSREETKTYINSLFTKRPNGITADIYINDTLAYKNLNLKGEVDTKEKMNKSITKVHILKGDNQLRIVCKKAPANNTGAFGYDYFTQL